jgi:hypothetical protein
MPAVVRWLSSRVNRGSERRGWSRRASDLRQMRASLPHELTPSSGPGRSGPSSMPWGVAAQPLIRRAPRSPS